MLKRYGLVIALLSVGSAFGSVTNTWVGTLGTTPWTAAVWNESANWKGGIVPTDYDRTEISSSKKGFLKLPDNLILGGLICNNAPFLLGEQLTFSSAGLKETPRINYSWIYADVALNHDANDKEPWFQASRICGRVTGTKALTPASGLTALRLDRFATTSNPIRTDDISSTMDIRPGCASFSVHVQGADAFSSAWAQTNGSPYLVRADTSTALLAPGAIVTGTGIPEGTFVRRVFTELNAVELSQNVTVSSASNTLAFAAFHPDARLRVHAYSTQGVNDLSWLKLYRRHAADQLVLELDKLSSEPATMESYIHGIDNSDTDDWLPGTLRLHDVTDGGLGELPTDMLANCHIEFAGTMDGKDTTFSAIRVVGFYSETPTATARLTVPTEKTGVISVFTNFTGTVVKDGVGTLKIGLALGTNTGAITLEEGTLELTACATAGTGPVSFATLTQSAGTTLKIPASGMYVTTATFEDGAILQGPGILTVGSAQSGRVTCTDGAVIAYACGAENVYVHAPTVAAAGHPAFWVDASKTDSLVYTTEAGVNYVTRWNDCRAGEPMFATNVIRRPVLVQGGTMANTYVKINHVETQWYTNTEGLVWSQPIRDIRAVFLVQDPTDGGGEILGRTSRLPNNYYGSQGGPYYRAGANWGNAIVNESYATPCVKNGRFFLNGTEVVGYKKGYLGAYLQLLEHHVNTEYAAGSASSELVCDAFGTGGYQDGHIYSYMNGYQRIAECLIYTNTLTHAERVATALYLSRKWLGKDIFYSDVDEPSILESVTLSEGEAMSVAAEKTCGIRSVEDSSPFGKVGAGRLVVDALAAGAVVVGDGELLIKSLSRANDSVPDTPWVHVDASDTSLLTLGDDNAVTRWHNRMGDGWGYVPLTTGTPKLVPNALNGLPVIDCGTRGGADKAAFILKDANGTQFVHGNTDSYITGAPYYKTVFVVYGSKGGGNAILGNYWTGFPYQGFGYCETAATKVLFPVTDNSNYQIWNNDSRTAISNGTIIVRQNGARIDPFTKPFSGGYDQLTYWGNLGRKSDTLATYGPVATYVGGLEYGEVLIYSNQIDKVALPKVEAYLRKKWFDVDSEGYRVASCTSLEVAAGATVRVCDWAAARGSDAYDSGTGTLKTSALAGGGTVIGDITLTENGVVAATIANGTLPTLTVTGSLTLPQTGTMRITGDVASLALGRYTLLSCTGLAANELSGWTIDAPARPRRVYHVSCVANELVLDVAELGTVIIIR